MVNQTVLTIAEQSSSSFSAWMHNTYNRGGLRRWGGERGQDGDKPLLLFPHIQISIHLILQCSGLISKFTLVLVQVTQLLEVPWYQDGGIQNCHLTFLSLPWHVKCCKILNVIIPCQAPQGYTPMLNGLHGAAITLAPTNSLMPQQIYAFLVKPDLQETQAPLCPSLIFLSVLCLWHGFITHLPFWKTVMNKLIVTAAHVIPHVLYRNKPFSYTISTGVSIYIQYW